MNHLVMPVFMAVPKPMLTEFGIDRRLEICDALCVFIARLLSGGCFLRYGLAKVSFKWLKTALMRGIKMAPSGLMSSRGFLPHCFISYLLYRAKNGSLFMTTGGAVLK